MLSDKNIIELKEKLSTQNNRDFYLFREHYVFGHYPTFKTFDEPVEIRYAVYKFLNDAEGRWEFLNKQEMLAYLKEYWRPADKEGQDFFLRLDEFFKEEK